MSQGETQFLQARQEWDDRFSNLARGKRNWQLAALGLLLTTLVLSLSLGWLATQSRVTPFVVEVDQLGQAVAFGPAEKLRQTDERVLRYLLSLYIHDLRSVLTDPEAQKVLLDRAYAYTRGTATAFLNSYFTDHNPFERTDQERIRVKVQSLLPISERTWQIQWVETRTSPSGYEKPAEGWQAILTVETDPPETTELLLINPLGLYVTEISWTQTLL